MAQISNDDSGRVVRYYKNGWRLGRLLRVEGSTAVIKNTSNQKKRDIKVLATDCELYLEARIMPSIFDELFKVAQPVGMQKQRIDQTDDEYLTTLVRAITTVDDEGWNSLSVQAQTWHNSAIDYVNKLLPVPVCPGFIGTEVVQHTRATVVPPKGLTADEIFKSKPPTGTAASRFQSTPSSPKVKATGIMDALRRTVIIHPEWTSRQVYDYLKLNGFPNAKLDTISVDGGNIRRVIEIARELGLWHDKKEEVKEEAEAEVVGKS